jgi:aryl-alcohol dehydrogenase-like predicted oxidoreductase
MKRRQIGNSELHVHEIGYGAMHLSIDPARRPSEADSITLLQRMVDELGIDFIDTADAYCADDSETGHNERLIANALQGERRGRVVIATKGGSVRPGGAWARDGRPKHLRSACEASLKALDTDRIDLYQLHAPDPNVPVEESVGTLADLQREGKIRYIGVSNFDLGQLERGLRQAEIVSLQNKFSVVSQREERELLDFCEKRSITYIPWNPIGGRGIAPTLGDQSSALEEIARAHDVSAHAAAIAWLLRLSPAMLPIPGTRSFEHLAENLQGAEITLSAEEMGRLNSKF